MASSKQRKLEPKCAHRQMDMHVFEMELGLASQTNKHVLVEKPLAADALEALGGSLQLFQSLLS